VTLNTNCEQLRKWNEVKRAWMCCSMIGHAYHSWILTEYDLWEILIEC